MCEVLQNSYITNAGKKVEIKPYINLDDIPEQVKKELEKSNATQLDLLLVRSGLAENKAESKKIKALAIENRNHITELKNKFYVKVKNGKDEEKHISDLIVEMYERETNRRHFNYLKNLISRHKKLTVGLIVFFILTNVILHNQIRDLFHWISENIIEILKLIF